MDEGVWIVGGMILTGKERKYTERNLSQSHFVHKTPTMD
jgi:hypothetical protein